MLGIGIDRVVHLSMFCTITALTACGSTSFNVEQDNPCLPEEDCSQYLTNDTAARSESEPDTLPELEAETRAIPDSGNDSAMLVDSSPTKADSLATDSLPIDSFIAPDLGVATDSISTDSNLNDPDTAVCTLRKEGEYCEQNSECCWSVSAHRQVCVTAFHKCG